MKHVLTSLLCIISAYAFAQDNAVINDKNAEVRNVGSFNEIKVSGAIDLYLSQSGTEAVAVSSNDEKVRDKIKTEVKDGVLNIYFKSEGLGFNWGNKKMTAYVSFKNINSLEISGASTCKITGSINTDDLKLTLSGASNIKGKLNIRKLVLNASGASDAKLSGMATNADINCSGASNLKAYDLITDECIAHASGASDIHITTKNQLSINATGASSIHYKGGAVIKDMHSSGASSVSKAD
jgi:hypothetical protein